MNTHEDLARSAVESFHTFVLQPRNFELSTRTPLSAPTRKLLANSERSSTVYNRSTIKHKQLNTLEKKLFSDTLTWSEAATLAHFSFGMEVLIGNKFATCLIECIQTLNGDSKKFAQEIKECSRIVVDFFESRPSSINRQFWERFVFELKEKIISAEIKPAQRFETHQAIGKMMQAVGEG